MREIASRGQLRMAVLRWVLVVVPAIVLLGFLSGRLANSSPNNGWYAMLAKPAAMPPTALFGIAWTVLYILIGVAFALVIAARGARWRGPAILLFLLQLVLNLGWAPLFFALHKVDAALILLVVLFLVAAAASALFALVRPVAGALMIPYLLWLLFAAYLNFEIGRLNPNAQTLAPRGSSTQIRL